MSNESPKDRLRDAGLTAWRLSILGIATGLVLVFYVGLAYLVYRGRLSDGALLLFTGVILGYLLRSVRDWM
jgi:hypothetical protein